jgi:magnesium transporter
VASALGLDRQAIADLVAEDRRAKFEQLGHSRLVITNVVALDKHTTELVVHPTSLVVTDRAVICLTGDVPGGFDAARRLTEAHELLAEGGVPAALHLLLSAVIDTYEAAVDWLEDASDTLTAALFEERPLDRQEQLRAFRLRTVLAQLNRLTEPMRVVMADLVDSYGGDDRLAARPWVALAEKHVRAANAADTLREVLTSISGTSLALADLRTNAIVKKLTGWAAIIAVPTLVTGFGGMNVRFPLANTTAGFWVYLLLMIAAIAALYAVFRRRDWL